jgi:hypothetical protein
VNEVDFMNNDSETLVAWNCFPRIEWAVDGKRFRSRR